LSFGIDFQELEKKKQIYLGCYLGWTNHIAFEKQKKIAKTSQNKFT